jgi:hypothetical protein
MVQGVGSARAGEGLAVDPEERLGTESPGLLTGTPRRPPHDRS